MSESGPTLPRRASAGESADWGEPAVLSWTTPCTAAREPARDGRLSRIAILTVQLVTPAQVKEDTYTGPGGRPSVLG